MAVRRFSVVVPKRGVQRLAQKNPATKKPAAYTKIDYVREKAAVASRGVRQEQMKSKRSLPELLKASDDEIIEMLLADGMLPDWTGKQCPRCDKGRLSKLSFSIPADLVSGIDAVESIVRCIYPRLPLQTQAAVLLMKLQNVSLPSTCQMLAVNHKLVEDMSTRLIYARPRSPERQKEGSPMRAQLLGRGPPIRPRSPERRKHEGSPPIPLRSPQEI